MSTLQSDTGDFVVISQVNHSRNLQDVPDEIHNIADTTPKPLKKFYKGEPEALGVTQVCSGICFLTFGVIESILVGSIFHRFDLFIYSGLPFWSGMSYIVSGSLSVNAAIKPTLGKVKASVILNIISSVFAGIAIILHTFDMVLSHNYYGYTSYCSCYKPSDICTGNFEPMVYFQGIHALLFLLSILQFCITISTSVFGCKTVCRTSYHEMTVIIYQTSSINTGDNATAADGSQLTAEEVKTD
uniref:Uncharacterized protein n=1 Tax=Leptobrachium leishanense TaxID=445787 RepID=A0A8C5MY02_9ANUR